jgi:hypothetical protein
MVGHDQLAAYVEERRGERRHALNVVDTVPRPCRDPKSVARLMREAIRGNQRSSVVISPCRDPKSVARLRSSVVISGHHWSSMVISGHQGSSAVVMSGHCSSVAVMRHHGHQRSLGVIRGHIGPVEAISCNLMQSHAISCNLMPVTRRPNGARARAFPLAAPSAASTARTHLWGRGRRAEHMHAGRRQLRLHVRTPIFGEGRPKVTALLRRNERPHLPKQGWRP